MGTARKLLAEFLRNEDGIFPLIAGAIVSTVASNYLAKKTSALNAGQNKRELKDYYTTLTEEAKKGGFHPLEALRAGHPSPGSSLPNIMSPAAAANLSDDVAEELSGMREVRDQRERLENELLRTEIDRERTGRIGLPYKGTDGWSHSPNGSNNQINEFDAEDTQGKDPQMTPTPFVEYRDPRYADAGDVAEAYGEGGEWIGGAVNWVRDRDYTAMLKHDVLAGRFESHDAANQYYIDNPDDIDGAVNRYKAEAREKREADRGYNDTFRDAVRPDEIRVKKLPPMRPPIEYHRQQSPSSR